MFFWFVAFAVCAVLFVFDSPAVDYRFVAAGSVAPLLEVAASRPLILHTLLGSVLILVTVMVVTIGRRLLRRKLLGLPIGTLLFTMAAGLWTRADLFWWPFLGRNAIASGPFPEFDRPLGLLLLMESIGIGTLLWLGYRLDLADLDNRNRLIATGRLPKAGLR